MAEQKQIQKNFFSALSSQSIESNLSSVILLMLISLVHENRALTTRMGENTRSMTQND